MRLNPRPLRPEGHSYPNGGDSVLSARLDDSTAYSPRFDYGRTAGSEDPGAFRNGAGGGDHKRYFVTISGLVATLRGKETKTE